MSHSTIFQLYRGDQMYWWRKPEYKEKTTDLLYAKCKRSTKTVLHSTTQQFANS